jgi:hypothetical protein
MLNFNPNHQVFFAAVTVLLTPFLGVTPTASFLMTPPTASNSLRTKANPSFLASLSLSTITENTETSADDSLLKPTYDIEAIPIRIGHGFDIHRMAPIQEAGQPVVIGGVEIIHADQKVKRPK